MDSSTSAECAEIAESTEGNKVVCDKSGSVMIERFTGPQIRRFYKINPNAYKETERIHLVSSFLCSILSGSDAPVDTGDGAGMNLLNLNNWAWDPELLNNTAPYLERKLPIVKSSKTIIGPISSYFVEKFGFEKNVAITIFTGDNPSSLVGMGASTPGKVVISLGTSDTVFAAMPKTVSDPEGCGHVFGNPAGGSMSLQCFINGSLAREAVKDKFHFDWDQFTNAIKNTKPGNEGALMIPFFRPEISPRLELKAPVLSGDADFMNWKQPEASIRACIEGQFINMRRSMQWMEVKPQTIYLTGGASENNAIAQTLADVFNVKVQRLAVSGSVALGAAMRAANINKGYLLCLLESYFCRPDLNSYIKPSGNSELYEPLFEKFEALIQSASFGQG
jgi:xylulokinase